MYYSDDEQYYSDEYDDVEECERDIVKDRDAEFSDEFIPADDLESNLDKENRNKKNNKEKKKGFDVDAFDVKVAISIRNIHKNAERDVNFTNWVKKNFYHLNKMYELSNTKDPVAFYRYVYDHSK